MAVHPQAHPAGSGVPAFAGQHRPAFAGGLQADGQPPEPAGALHRHHELLDGPAAVRAGVPGAHVPLPQGGWEHAFLRGQDGEAELDSGRDAVPAPLRSSLQPGR